MEMEKQIGDAPLILESRRGSCGGAVGLSPYCVVASAAIWPSHPISFQSRGKLPATSSRISSETAQVSPPFSETLPPSNIARLARRDAVFPTDKSAAPTIVYPPHTTMYTSSADGYGGSMGCRDSSQMVEGLDEFGT